MTVDARIKQALEPFGYKISSGTSSGENPPYFTFGYTVLGDGYADDEPTHERYLCHVELYLPLTFNYHDLSGKVKKTLHQAGFTWPNLYVTDDGTTRQLSYECETAEGVDI